MKTTHEVVVVKVVLEPAENSDNLAVARFNGYQVVTNRAGWKDYPTYPEILAIHVPPENMVDTRMDQFKFLAKDGKDVWQKVSTCKLRGNLSEGLFIPAPEGAVEGEYFTDRLNVKHVEDELELDLEKSASRPDYFRSHTLSKYDIDSAKNYYKEFVDGEECVITLKYHGQNCCFVWGTSEDCAGGKVYIRARTNWQTNDVKDNCYKAYRTHKDVYDKFCAENPHLVLWGEAIGGQGMFRYGLPPGRIEFIAFDIFDLSKNGFLNYDEFCGLCDKYNIPRVHEVYRGPYQFDLVKSKCEVPSTFNHPNEGIVVKPVVERKTKKFERLVFKIISPAYKMNREVDVSTLTLPELEELFIKVELAIKEIKNDQSKSDLLELSSN